MADPFLAEIKMFGGNFAPRGWAFCNGQLLAINNYQALFSLLGTTYGGDGRTSFGLPDLRGRAAIHSGNASAGPGLTPRPLGQKSGVEQVTLTANQIPSHHHTASNLKVGVSTQAADTDDPSGTVFGVGNEDAFFEGAANANMGDSSITGTTDNTGGSQPHTNMQPYLAVNYIIALQGTFPSRS
ncbi:phage tail protein [Verrucomicrobiaceae bacterium N1E253]|uniref:Phage tail protein n=1 Tax=Oceaniferula marina TaxID=2748318 RepID=A0A851GGC0_9BACT|nr:tail fiber protein [Oceaniferula marina]NWK55952.1 phage tail protein [Oceaniferula marina]